MLRLHEYTRRVEIADRARGTPGVTVASYDGRARRRARHAADAVTANGDEDEF
jgi:hypothetical protein